MPSQKPKPQLSAHFDPKKFSTYYSLFKTESYTATQENEQQGSIEAEIKVFFRYTKKLNAETEESKVLNWRKLNKIKHTHLASFTRKYFSAPPSSVSSVWLFSEAGNLYKQKRNRLLPKTGKKLLFLRHNFKKLD